MEINRVVFLPMVFDSIDLLARLLLGLLAPLQRDRNPFDLGIHLQPIRLSRKFVFDFSISARSGQANRRYRNERTVPDQMQTLLRHVGLTLAALRRRTYFCWFRTKPFRSGFCLADDNGVGVRALS